MTTPRKNNYAFVDGSNLYLGMRDVGWKLNYKRFRVFLRDRLEVSTAYIFLGYVPTMQWLYTSLQSWGYQVVLKPTIPLAGGNVKGNCDVDLTLRTMIEFDNFDGAVLVTADGDFLVLAQHLDVAGKLERIIAPQPRGCSSLLKKAFPPGKFLFVDQHRQKLEL